MVWGGRREEGSGWGTQIYLWRIHFDVWQNQYNIVKFQNKIKLKKINKVLLIVSGISLANNITIITILLLLNGEELGTKIAWNRKIFQIKVKSSSPIFFLSQST